VISHRTSARQLCHGYGQPRSGVEDDELNATGYAVSDGHEQEVLNGSHLRVQGFSCRRGVESSEQARRLERRTGTVAKIAGATLKRSIPGIRDGRGKGKCQDSGALDG
jgi:hypothetical protein